jgi:lauroyl/myristoyl acyltransferase
VDPFIRMTDHELLEQSFAIAWNTLDMSGDREDAARYLADKIEQMIKRGESAGFS